MIRRIICVVLVIVTAVTCVSPCFCADEEISGYAIIISNDGNWYLSLVDDDESVLISSGILTLSAYLGQEKDITVPPVIDSYKVVGLGEYAFCECRTARTVILSDGIESVGLCAFSNCDSLVEVKIPDSVSEIDETAFDEGSKIIINASSGSAGYNYATEHNMTVVSPVSSGKKALGWKKINGVWYYFDTDAMACFGWNKIGGSWYYFNKSGIMQTGWKKINGKWYYLSSDGVMKTGWQKTGGKWYYLLPSGEMATGWKKLSGKWYYLGSDGQMRTGWAKIKDKWYYFNVSGVMQKGWLKLSGKWYYLTSSGVMVTGKQEIEGKVYYFDTEGRWIKLDTKSQRTVYITKTGTKYHYDCNCGNNTYISVTLADALKLNLTPCEKCVKG